MKFSRMQSTYIVIYISENLLGQKSISSDDDNILFGIVDV